MGELRSYKCNSCDYKVDMYGGPSGLFTGSTDTYECLNCSHLSDLITEYMDSRQNPPIFKCDRCKSKNVQVWDHENKTCPKCKEGKLDIDPDGVWIMED